LGEELLETSFCLEDGVTEALTDSSVAVGIFEAEGVKVELELAGLVTEGKEIGVEFTGLGVVDLVERVVNEVVVDDEFKFFFDRLLVRERGLTSEADK
jgi:hypothetical protein